MGDDAGVDPLCPEPAALGSGIYKLSFLGVIFYLIERENEYDSFSIISL
jgi:hypothetical protein